MSLSLADKWFSIYIRIRDSDTNGITTCCSCSKKVQWRQSDAGHYVNRKHMSLRFSEINVNSQCRSCNRFDEGNIPAYGLFLQKKYGDDIIAKLLLTKQKTHKISKYELKEIANFYKVKAKDLANLKHIEI